MLFSFSGQKESLCQACQGFRGKYKLSEAKSGDFPLNAEGAPTLTSRKRHSDTFAQRKGEQHQEWFLVIFRQNCRIFVKIIAKKWKSII